jgi:hypothetical protein
MATPIGSPSVPGYVGSTRLLSNLAGNDDLTTTRTHFPIPAGIKAIKLQANTYAASAVLAKYALNPFLQVVVTMDAMATDPTDVSENVQDGVAATVATLSNLPTLANGGAIYIGATEPFSGFYVDVTNPDGGAGTMAVAYWDGNSWENITPTDNTSNWGNDGVANWTVPSAWSPATLFDALALGAPRKHTGGNELYWVRVSTSVALDSDTTVTGIYAINRYADTTPGLIAGESFVTAISRAQNGGNLQALTDVGTANLIVTGFY